MLGKNDRAMKREYHYCPYLKKFMKQKYKNWLPGYDWYQTQRHKAWGGYIQDTWTGQPQGVIYRRKGKFPVNPGSADSGLGQVRDNTERREEWPNIHCISVK